jgi:hypothetical protein
MDPLRLFDEELRLCCPIAAPLRFVLLCARLRLDCDATRDAMFRAPWLRVAGWARQRASGRRLARKP